MWEATAPKPGNVHRGADFEDVTYVDFIQSAVVIGPILERARELGVGRTVLEAVRATRDAVGTNTNLGTLLLLARWRRCRTSVPLADGIGDVLRPTDVSTIRGTCTKRFAFRLPADLGATDEGRRVRRSAAELDARRRHADGRRTRSGRRQYTNEFADVFDGTADVD